MWSPRCRTSGQCMTTASRHAPAASTTSSRAVTRSPASGIRDMLGGAAGSAIPHSIRVAGFARCGTGYSLDVDLLERLHGRRGSLSEAGGARGARSTLVLGVRPSPPNARELRPSTLIRSIGSCSRSPPWWRPWRPGSRGFPNQSDSDVSELPVEQHVATRGAVHPRLDDGPRRPLPPHSPGEGLTHAPGAVAGQVARGVDPGHEVLLSGALMREAVAPLHVPRVPLAGLAEGVLRVDAVHRACAASC